MQHSTPTTASLRGPAFIALCLLALVSPPLRAADRLATTDPSTANSSAVEADLSPDLLALLRQALAARAAGQYALALADFARADEAAQTSMQRSLTSGEVGALLTDAKRFDGALPWVERAYAAAAPGSAQRARMAVRLGNLRLWQKDRAAALTYFNEASCAQDAQIRAAAGLARLRLWGRKGLQEEMQRIAALINSVADAQERGSLSLRLANFALSVRESDASLDTRAIAFASARQALTAGEQIHHRRLQVAAWEALGRLYEAGLRTADALDFTRRGIALANPDHDADLLIRLEWRRARLLNARGDLLGAIEAYRQAVANIERIRIDIPVVYEDGRSSFRETLGPIFLGLADLLLQQAKKEKDPVQVTSLRRQARDAAEGVKQSELQDYLGDRCTVESQRQSTEPILAADTAIVYPIVFADRVETLVETHNGIKQYASATPIWRLQSLAFRYANALRQGADKADALGAQLYDVLMAPISAGLKAAGINKLVIVPDGVLRVVPYAALIHNHRYVIEDYAVSNLAALSLTQTDAQSPRTSRLLIAGLSTPGPVVRYIAQNLLGAAGVKAAGSRHEENCVNPSARVFLEGVSTPDSAACNLDEDAVAGAAGLGANKTGALGLTIDPSQRAAAASAKSEIEAEELLRASLALPGVKEEIANIRAERSATVLLNKQFTLSAFSGEIASGAFDEVHIASHGVFGGSSDNSYLLANDRLITMDDLQNILRQAQLKAGNDHRGIDLLTLSACETAEGDDRAPLGIAGAALKAQAKSVVGTLWPVADDAAVSVMTNFYAALVKGQDKTDALRFAQLQLLKDPRMRHPFFWAPFTLVGNWL